MSNYYSDIPDSPDIIEAKRISKLYSEHPEELKTYLKTHPTTLHPKKGHSNLKVGRGKCPNPVGRILRHSIFHDVACKSWKCSHCSKVKKLKLIKRFELHKKGGLRYRMLTLTEWKHPSNLENSKHLTQHWARLRASLRKHKIIMIDFFWTKEYKPLHNKGSFRNILTCPDCNWIGEPIDMVSEDNMFMCPQCGAEFPSITENDLFNLDLLYPHLHIIVPAYINLELLSRLWFLATNQTADQVHIPKDDNLVIKNPVAYMTKYFTDSDMQLGFSKGERRYGCSRQYPAKEQPLEFTIELDGVSTTIKYTPFAGKGGQFIFNTWKVSDDHWIRREQIEDEQDRSWRKSKQYASMISNEVHP